MNYSWVLVLNSYLMIAVLGPLCTSRLSSSSSPLMNVKQVRSQRQGVKTSPFSSSQNVFCAAVVVKLQTQSHLKSVWCIACWHSLSAGLLRWTLTYSRFQNSFLRVALRRIDTLSVRPTFFFFCKMGFALLPNANRLLSRLKPRCSKHHHTTVSIQSAAHFSPHLPYIIHTIKHIRSRGSHCTVPFF